MQWKLADRLKIGRDKAYALIKSSSYGKKKSKGYGVSDSK